MKRLIFISFFLLWVNSIAQGPYRPSRVESEWDQGVPIMPGDPYIMGLINQLGDSLRDWDWVSTPSKAKLCREIGLAFYDKGMYEAADWYLKKAKNYREEAIAEKMKPKLSDEDAKKILEDQKFLAELPKNYDELPKEELANLVKKIESQIRKLIFEKDSLIQVNAPKEIIEAKENSINSLKKEKKIINLSLDNIFLTEEGKRLRAYLTLISLIVLLLTLAVIALAQRKRIKIQDVELEDQFRELAKKNTYLEHAARLIRHDMHSGINTYIPKGMTSLTSKLSEDNIKTLKIESALRLIKEGLTHTQRVYKSIYEFTNLVKKDAILKRIDVDLKVVIENYITNAAYRTQVSIDDLIVANVNEVLFGNAIDNLIRNGLAYNSSKVKHVKIYMEDQYLVVHDNGTGMTQQEFEKNCFTSANKKNRDIDKATSGLGLNICVAILQEHGFELSCEKAQIGTKMKIWVKS